MKLNKLQHNLHCLNNISETAKYLHKIKLQIDVKLE